MPREGSNNSHFSSFLVPPYRCSVIGQTTFLLLPDQNHHVSQQHEHQTVDTFPRFSSKGTFLSRCCVKLCHSYEIAPLEMRYRSPKNTPSRLLCSLTSYGRICSILTHVITIGISGASTAMSDHAHGQILPDYWDAFGCTGPAFVHPQSLSSLSISHVLAIMSCPLPQSAKQQSTSSYTNDSHDSTASIVVSNKYR